MVNIPKHMIFSVVLKFITTLYLYINVIKIPFQGTWASFYIFSINLVKLHMLPKSVDKNPQQNRYYSETETTKVPNLSNHHHMLVYDTNMN